jgi:predicted RNA binding protein YcfA (HicA-like mRNA interferase family)
LSRLKCKFGEFVDILLANGFVLHRQDGTSHSQYRKQEGNKVFLVTVSSHGDNDDIKTGTLQSMIRQSGLSKKLFRK